MTWAQIFILTVIKTEENKYWTVNFYLGGPVYERSYGVRDVGGSIVGRVRSKTE